MALSAEYIQVTNNSGMPIEGRYDGEDYDFPERQAVIVPRLVATHVLGFGVPDKRRILMQLGWLRWSDEESTAMDRLRKIRFEAVEMVGKTLDDEVGVASQELAPDSDPIGSSARPSDGAGGAGAGTQVPAVAPVVPAANPAKQLQTHHRVQTPPPNGTDRLITDEPMSLDDTV